MDSCDCLACFRLISKWIESSSIIKLRMPPCSQNSSISLTVKIPFLSVCSMISARSLSSDGLTNRMPGDFTCPTSSTVRVLRVQPDTRFPLSPDNASLIGPSPKMEMVRTCSFCCSRGFGQSMNLMKLNVNAALILYSSGTSPLAVEMETGSNKKGNRRIRIRRSGVRPEIQGFPCAGATLIF